MTKEATYARKDDPWCSEERRLRDIRDRTRQHADSKLRWKCDPIILTTFLPDNVDPEYIDRYWKAIEKVQCPFMEVRGKESITVSDETIEKMHMANKLFSSVDVDGAGHEVTTDKPHEFIAVTREFLSVNE